MTKELPKAPFWNLSLFYQSIDDPQVEKDLQQITADTKSFVQKYQGKVAGLSSQELSDLMEDLEQIYQRLGRVSTYAFLNYATQTQEASAGAFLQKVQEFGSNIHKEIVFFELEWAEVAEEISTETLKAPEIAKYRHYLQTQRRYRPYLLSEVEEKLLAQISPIGVSAWTALFDKVVSKIEFGEKKRTEEEVLSELYHSDRQVRKQAAKELTQGLQSQMHILTHIFNTVTANKQIHDRIRTYPTWLTSRNLANEVDDQTVQTLIRSVQSRYDIVQRYYQLKQKIIGVEALYDYDRYAPLPMVELPLISWEECQDIVVSAFQGFSPMMAGIATRFFQDQRIDGQVRAGKRGGAFSHPATPDTHPYVLVNYTGNARDVSTVAHELGHGIHQYLSGQEQGYLNSHTPLTTAESASVFGEMLTFRYQFAQLEDQEAKLSLLCYKLESIFATIFRQVSMSAFENLLHRARREEGELSQERMSTLWMETQREMFADSVILEDHYQIWWSYIPHFLHTPGYVYAYAFGELLVLSLYQRYQETGSFFVEKYVRLLSAGGNASPVELLKPFDIHLDDPEFWNQGLSILDQMVQEAEELYQLCGERK